MANSFGRRGIAYTPFFKEGAQAMGEAVTARNERWDEEEINELAQKAWMGDPVAVQELAGRDPELAATVEEGAAERVDRQTQRDVEKDARFVEDVDTAMAQIGAFDTYEEAQAFGTRIQAMLREKYPERSAARGTPEEFTEEFYNEIRTITGGGHGKPIGVHFPGIDKDGNPVMYERLELPNGRTIARKIKDQETGEYVTPARWDAMTAERLAYAKGLGTAEARIDLMDEEAIAELSAEALKTITPLRNNTMKSIGVIKALRNHPGLDSVVGMGWLNPAKWMPGTDAHDFQKLAEQAEGVVFSSAYQTLKGGGPITDIEGRKASQAIARMEQSQSKEEYLRALDDFEESMRTAYKLKLDESRGIVTATELPEDIPASRAGGGEPGETEATAIDATSVKERPPAGTWVRFPDGTVRQM